jgi:hypothetical protein
LEFGVVREGRNGKKRGGKGTNSTPRRIKRIVPKTETRTMKRTGSLVVSLIGKEGKGEQLKGRRFYLMWAQGYCLLC